MTSVVSICNMALMRVGVNQTINSLDDRNTKALACKTWYEHCRDEVLSDAPWNWAMRAAPLAKLPGDPPPGWAHHYAYPEDCLALKDVVLECDSHTPVYGWHRENTTNITFEVRSGVSGTVIACDHSEPWALYVTRVTDPNRFDPQFVDTLVWRLARELAMALSADANKAQQAEVGYQMSKSSALARMMREQRSPKKPESPSIQARR